MAHNFSANLNDIDNDVFNLIESEKKRQEFHIELIASENYVSKAVLEAQGSILTNKYAEGYPHKRYYGGCQYVDQIEEIAINRIKTLFNAEYANVQPHSGSQANQAVYFAVLKPGDTVLGLSLANGGHLTHGSKVNLSGKLYNFISYGLDNNEIINYEEVEELAIKHKPKLIVTGASSYTLTIDFKKFRDIANKVNAYFMVDMAHYAGLIATSLYPDPIPYADFVTSTTHKTLRGPRGGIILAKKEHEKLINSAIFPGIQGGPLEHVIAAKAVAFKEALTSDFKTYQSQVKKNALVLADTLKARGFRIVFGTTESHMVLIDVSKKNITGKLAEDILSKANITTNKNAIPNDKEPPTITSGIRIGTPAITTRGFKERECELVANSIANVLEDCNNSQVINATKEQMVELCKLFPIYR